MRGPAFAVQSKVGYSVDIVRVSALNVADPNENLVSVNEDRVETESGCMRWLR